MVESASRDQKHGKVAVISLIIVIITAIVVATSLPGIGLLFALAIAPTVFLLWYFYHADKYKHESTRLLGGTFLIGALSIIPAVVVESHYTQPTTGLLDIFLYFLLGVGVTEELMKFLSVRLYPYRSKHFDEPMDGIVFGVAAALGFATIENILYVLKYGIETAVVRAIVSVPGHAFWGAIIGFYLAEAKVRRQPLLALEGLAFTIFLHGLFDTVATVVPSDIVSLALLGALTWTVYFKVVKKEVAEAEAESPYAPTRNLSTAKEHPATSRAPKFCPQCGAHVEVGATFCVNCGRQLEEV